MTKNIHIHIHTADSFDESKHPRANNGQFGAGEGKTHAEHAAHHHQLSIHHVLQEMQEKAKGKRQKEFGKKTR